MKRNAIIIAAGTSSRFVPLSYERPKGLVEVRNEILIERQICQLKAAGVDDITIVVGYMAGKFTYLAEKYGVRFVRNEDYLLYNNTSSIIRVCDLLANTYICCSDQYYENNPFLLDLQESAYAVLYAKGKTNEYCLDLDDNGRIHNVRIGGQNDWYMAGYSYFTEEFSDAFGKILREEYQNEETRQLYWEDVYMKHIQELPMMRAIKFDDADLREFDSLDELRLFDTSYLNDTRSKIIEEIACQLHCNEKELTGFKKINGNGIIFCFQYNKNNFLYQNGDIKQC